MNIEESFEHGEDVLPLSGNRGRVIDIRDASDGTTLFGVLTTNGAVSYYTADGLKHAVPQAVKNITF